MLVDAGDASPHEAVIVELPVLVAVGAEPVVAVVVELVGKAHGDAVARKCPHLDQPVVEFTTKADASEMCPVRSGPKADMEAERPHRPERLADSRTYPRTFGGVVLLCDVRRSPGGGGAAKPNPIKSGNHIPFIGRSRCMSSRLEYRADLDGLRAVAVIPVVLFHLGVTALPGGFVGVDVFFVLSGFLITSLLATDLERGAFSLSAFYDRRIRRIVPALVLVLAFCAVVAPLILFPTDLIEFGGSLEAAALSASNFQFARDNGYFAPDADLAPLLHTWSLAVEEQFYILFPVLLWAAWRWARKWLASILWLTLALSFALSVWGVEVKPTPTFYLLPTRAWELLLGAVLALELVRKPNASWQRELAAAAGVLAILAAMTLYTRDTKFPGVAALMPSVGAALVIWAGVGSTTWTGRALANPIPVLFGLVSYSLYLWHWPLIVLHSILRMAV